MHATVANKARGQMLGFFDSWNAVAMASHRCCVRVNQPVHVSAGLAGTALLCWWHTWLQTAAPSVALAALHPRPRFLEPASWPLQHLPLGPVHPGFAAASVRPAPAARGRGTARDACSLAAFGRIRRRAAGAGRDSRQGKLGRSSLPQPPPHLRPAVAVAW
jgi:hypothetical protein